MAIYDTYIYNYQTYSNINVYVENGSSS
jgi:hypothetical protein